MLLLQFVLIPILTLVQELTVRLGIHSGRGHGKLIRDTFGPVWAWVSVAGLPVASGGALVTEFSGPRSASTIRAPVSARWAR